MANKSSRFLLLGLFAILAPCTNAVAQDPRFPDDKPEWEPYYNNGSGAAFNSFAPSTRAQDNTALRRMEEGARIAIASSSRNNFNSLGTTLDNNDSSAYIGRLYDYNSWCGDGFSGDDYCVQNDAMKTLPRTTGQRLSSFNTLSPMSGVADVTNARAYTDLVTTGLTSQLAVLNSTMQLTEPGIAFGVANAMNFANGAVTNRYQQDNAVLARQKVNPGTGELFVQMYENCLAKTRASGKSWIQAQSECAGGDRFTPSAQNLDAPTAGTMMNFQQDPNHPLSLEIGATGSYTDGQPFRANRIRALDYLFNQERKYVNNPSEQGISFDELRRSFEGMIGDIEFVISNPQDNGNLYPLNSNLNPGTKEGTMSITTRRIAPTYGHKTYFRNLVTDRYRDFTALLRIQCEYFATNQVYSGAAFSNTIENPEMPQGDKTAVTQYLSPSATYANFWADSAGAHQLLVRLSTTGYQPSPKVIDSVFAMFLDERATEYDTAVPDRKDLEKLPCDRLGTATGQPSNLFSMLSDSGGEAVQGRKLAINVQDRFRAVFAMAEKVALGQYLGTLAKAEDFVKELTGGAYENLIRHEMLEMIYSTAGTRELRQAQDLNDRQLRESAVPLLRWYNARNQQSAQSVQGSLERGGLQGDAASITTN